MANKIHPAFSKLRLSYSHATAQAKINLAVLKMRNNRMSFDVASYGKAKNKILAGIIASSVA